MDGLFDKKILGETVHFKFGMHHQFIMCQIMQCDTTGLQEKLTSIWKPVGKDKMVMNYENPDCVAHIATFLESAVLAYHQQNGMEYKYPAGIGFKWFDALGPSGVVEIWSVFLRSREVGEETVKKPGFIRRMFNGKSPSLN